MANLTITVDDGVLRRARARAAERGTSVNAVLNEYLASFAGVGAAERARARFLEIAEAVNGSSGTTGRAWTRDELHDR